MAVRIRPLGMPRDENAIEKYFELGSPPIPQPAKQPDSQTAKHLTVREQMIAQANATGRMIHPTK